MKTLLIVLLVVSGMLLLLLLLLLELRVKELMMDVQTRVRSFRWFKSRLTFLIGRQSKRPFPMTLAILDIDDFKRFNKISIRLGDEMLTEFASRLNDRLYDNISKRDLVRYRFGDEFAIIFENLDYAKSKKILDLIVDGFANNSLNVAASPYNHVVTFCYGLAEFQKGDTLESIIERAENDLIKQKCLAF